MFFNFMAAITDALILDPPQKIKSDTVCTVSPSISHEVMGPDAMILVIVVRLRLYHKAATHLANMSLAVLTITNGLVVQ